MLRATPSCSESARVEGTRVVGARIPSPTSRRICSAICDCRGAAPCRRIVSGNCGGGALWNIVAPEAIVPEETPSTDSGCEGEAGMFPADGQKSYRVGQLARLARSARSKAELNAHPGPVGVAAQRPGLGQRKCHPAPGACGARVTGRLPCERCVLAAPLSPGNPRRRRCTRDPRGQSRRSETGPQYRRETAEPEPRASPAGWPLPRGQHCCAAPGRGTCSPSRHGIRRAASGNVGASSITGWRIHRMAHPPGARPEGPRSRCSRVSSREGLPWTSLR